MAEFPRAWEWRRPNPAAWGGFSTRFARIRTPQFPAFPLENLQEFIEKPREFIGIYRILSKFRIPGQANRPHHHTGMPRIRADGKCGEMRVQAPAEDDPGRPGERPPQRGPTSQNTPARPVPRHRNCGQMRPRTRPAREGFAFLYPPDRGGRGGCLSSVAVYQDIFIGRSPRDADPERGFGSVGTGRDLSGPPRLSEGLRACPEKGRSHRAEYIRGRRRLKGRQPVPADGPARRLTVCNHRKQYSDIATPKHRPGTRRVQEACIPTREMRHAE